MAVVAPVKGGQADRPNKWGKFYLKWTIVNVLITLLFYFFCNGIIKKYLPGSQVNESKETKLFFFTLPGYKCKTVGNRPNLKLHAHIH
jgi:hypothetical protein